jgi:O-antigen ligase
MKSLVLADSRGKAFTRKEKSLYFLTAGFFISLFLPDMPVINNIFIGALLVYSFFYNTLSEKKQLLGQRAAIQFMLLFYLLHILSALFSVNKPEALNMLGLRVPLLLFPLSIGLIYIREELRDRILLCFCVIVTITAGVCLGYALIQYGKTGDSGWLYDDSLTVVIRRQSIYIALAVNLALFGYIHLLTRADFRFRHTALAWCAIVFLAVFQFILASRISLIVLFSSLLIFALYTVVKKGRFRKIGMIMTLGLLVCGALLIKFFPKTLNRFRELEYTGYAYNSQAPESHYNGVLTADQWNGANIRLAVWSCGWELAKKNLLAGATLGDKQDELMQVYRERQFEFAFRSRRNMHSTYLDTLCTFGVVGLAVFLAGWLLFPLLGCRRNRDRLGPFIIAAFAAAMITESYFDRSIGCLLAGFFLCLVVSIQKSPGSGPLRSVGP